MADRCAHMRADDLLSRTRLATQAGVSATTLKNWTMRDDRPLRTVVTSSGTQMYSWQFLLDFCSEHPELRGVETALAHSQMLLHGDDGPPPPANDQVTLQAALRDLKTAVDCSTAAVLRSAQLAQETATAHAEIIVALRDTIRAYDSAMTSMTAPGRLTNEFT